MKYQAPDPWLHTRKIPSPVAAAAFCGVDQVSFAADGRVRPAGLPGAAHQEFHAVGEQYVGDLHVRGPHHRGPAGDTHPIADTHFSAHHPAAALRADGAAFKLPDHGFSALVRSFNPQEDVRICPGELNDLALEFGDDIAVVLGHGMVRVR